MPTKLITLKKLLAALKLQHLTHTEALKILLFNSDMFNFFPLKTFVKDLNETKLTKILFFFWTCTPMSMFVEIIGSSNFYSTWEKSLSC